jgi:hypothetical protein
LNLDLSECTTLLRSPLCFLELEFGMTMAAGKKKGLDICRGAHYFYELLLMVYITTRLAKFKNGKLKLSVARKPPSSTIDDCITDYVFLCFIPSHAVDD